MPNNPFTATYMFGATGGKFGPYAYAFLGITLVVLGLCIAYYYTLGKNRFHGHGLRARLADKVVLYTLLWSLFVLFIDLMRLVHVPAITTRFVFVLSILGGLALVGYYAYFYRTRYPAMHAEYEDQRRKLRYMPPASLPGASYNRRRAKRR